MTLKKRFLGGNPVLIFAIFFFHAYIMWNLLFNLYFGVYQPIFECRYKGFNFLEKGLKNNLENIF